MEPLNIKIIPFAVFALVFSFLAFNTAISLIPHIEIMFSLEQVLLFLLILSLDISLVSFCLALVLSQVKSIYYKIGLFFLIFLPYASVFMLKYPIDSTMMLAVFVLFAAMVFTIITDFGHTYGNQIKTDLGAPAKANARSITFFIALVTALVFFSTSNNPESQKASGDQILNLTKSSITSAMQDYDIVGMMSSQMDDGSGAPPLTAAEKIKMQPQINKAVTDQITTMLTPYLPYIIYILAFLIFGTVAGAATFVGIFTTILGWVILYFLKSIGYVQQTKQMVEVTRITL